MTTTQPLHSQQLDNDEIDLRQVAAALGRHRKLFGSITAAAVVLSGIYAFTRKPVWQGQFRSFWKIRTPPKEVVWRNSSSQSNVGWIGWFTGSKVL